MLKSVNFFYQ